MSYDLCCWKPADDHEMVAQVVYERLCEDEEPEGLTWLPVDEIKVLFAHEFPTIEDFGTELNWEGDNGALQVTWPIGSKPQHALGWFVLCSWELAEDTEIIGRIGEVASALGCSIYDPQTGKIVNFVKKR